MISSAFRRLMPMMIVHQIIIGYLGCFMNQSAYSVLNNTAYVMIFCALSEVLSDCVRVFAAYFIPKLSGTVIINRLHFSASFLGVVSGVCFCCCLIFRYDSYFYLSWIINRIAFGFTAALRDVILYRMLYLTYVNIPFIKSFKSLGTILTSIHLIFSGIHTNFTMACIMLNSLLSLLVACICMLEFSRTKVFEIQICDDINEKVYRVNVFDAVVVITITLVMALSAVSEQIIFGYLSNKYAVIGKCIGQTIFGFIYSMVCGNSVYAASIYPFVMAIFYILLFFKQKWILFVAAILIGLCIQIQNSMYTILPRFLARFNGIYLSFTILSFALGKFVSSALFTAMQRFNVPDGKIILILVKFSMFAALFNLIAVYLCLRHKSKGLIQMGKINNKLL